MHMQSRTGPWTSFFIGCVLPQRQLLLKERLYRGVFPDKKQELSPYGGANRQYLHFLLDWRIARFCLSAKRKFSVFKPVIKKFGTVLGIIAGVSMSFSCPSAAAEPESAHNVQSADSRTVLPEELHIPHIMAQADDYGSNPNEHSFDYSEMYKKNNEIQVKKDKSKSGRQKIDESKVIDLDKIKEHGSSAPPSKKKTSPVPPAQNAAVPSQDESAVLKSSAPTVNTKILMPDGPVEFQDDGTDNDESGTEASPAPEESKPEVKEAPKKPKVMSVPYHPRNIRIVTNEDGSLPVSMQELLDLSSSKKLHSVTPSFFLNNNQRLLELPSKAKMKLRFDIRPLRVKKLLLTAFHIPYLKSEGDRAAKAWVVNGDSGIFNIDLYDMHPGVYSFCAVALNDDETPAARPSLDIINVCYGGPDAKTDYEDRRKIVLNGTSVPMGFSKLKPEDTVKAVSLFKVLPAACVLKPGEDIELKVEMITTAEERRQEAIHERYRRIAAAGKGASEAEVLQAAAAAEEAKRELENKRSKRRFLWSMYGKGTLKVTGNLTAVYYAPQEDMTGAEIRCWQEGDDNVVTVPIYVTTIPIGEIPTIK